MAAAVSEANSHFTTNPYVLRVGDSNEPGPEKWLPGDPCAPCRTARPT